jgi:polyphosphate glucokinase
MQSHPAAVPDEARSVGQGPLTLSVDIGGTKMKACVVDAHGHALADPLITSTPQPSPPDAVVGTIFGLAESLQPFDRISVGFPGVVRGPIVVTAPNLGTPQWTGFDLVAALSRRFDVPVRILNDAAVQGLGVVRGPGLETVITLGTGIGCSVFRDRRWLLHLELALDAFAGNAVLSAIGQGAWNERIAETITVVSRLTACERLYVGGGNARKVSLRLPPHVEIVSNMAGLTGGVRLWEPQFDDVMGSVTPKAIKES